MQNEHEIEINLESIDLMRQAIAEDAALRNQFKTGERYGFVEEKLQSILAYMEANLEVDEQVIQKAQPWEKPISDHECLVYVYLYSAHGKEIHAWERLLQDKALHEHSVNRPIYDDRSFVETLLRSKTQPIHNAYATIAVKKNHVIANANRQDALGQPLLRLVEGSLQFDRIIEFHHNGKSYYVDHRDRLVSF